MSFYVFKSLKLNFAVAPDTQKLHYALDQVDFSNKHALRMMIDFTLTNGAKNKVSYDPKK